MLWQKRHQGSGKSKNQKILEPALVAWSRGLGPLPLALALALALALPLAFALALHVMVRPGIPAQEVLQKPLEVTVVVLVPMTPPDRQGFELKVFRV